MAAQRECGLAHAHGQRVVARKACGQDANGLARQETDFHETQQQFLLGRVARRMELDHARRNLADRKSTRLNSSHSQISYAVFCLKKKTPNNRPSSYGTGEGLFPS